MKNLWNDDVVKVKIIFWKIKIKFWKISLLECLLEQGAAGGGPEASKEKKWKNSSRKVSKVQKCKRPKNFSK